MVRRARAPRAIALAAGVLVFGASCAARGAPSVLDPRGPAERHVTALWWPMLWVSVGVTAFVVVMGGWGVARGRRRDESAIARHVPWGDRFILISGLGVTSAILIGFFVFSLWNMASLARARTPALEITVTGHDWWWEASYPNGAVTANEIHIPAGQRVQIDLRGADVIHSFWVPELAPKIDLIPGRNNGMWIEADRPGRYRGQCAEYCGLQHAHMAFFVVADPPATFQLWLQQMAAPAPSPPDAQAQRGQEVFLENTCIGCHAVRGTRADGALGPDLTHLATRATFAAGTLPLTDANLRRWILDPQSIKPGVTMPPTTLSRADLDALVAYLLSLGASS